MTIQHLSALALLVTLSIPMAAQSSDRKSAESRRALLASLDHNGLNTTAGDALLLRILIEARTAKRGVEIGVAYGFGAINMGIGFERTGGHLYSLEIDPARCRTIRENVAKAGLEDVITVVEGDALKTLPTLSGEFDFVFIDAQKPDYLKYLKAIEPKLKPGAVVVADNVIAYARSMNDFLSYVQNNPNYETVTLRASMDKGDGMTVSYKIR